MKWDDTLVPQTEAMRRLQDMHKLSPKATVLIESVVISVKGTMSREIPAMDAAVLVHGLAIYVADLEHEVADLRSQTS